MKTKFYKVAILLFAVSMSLMSCNSDERNAEKIVGTWTCVSSYDHFWRIIPTHPEYSSDYENTDERKSDVAVFKEDGTVETTSDKLLEYYVSKDEKDRYTYDWSILDDTLYIGRNNYGKYSWHIETLTKNKLVISREYEETSLEDVVSANENASVTKGEKRIREFKR